MTDSDKNNTKNTNNISGGVYKLLFIVITVLFGVVLSLVGHIAKMNSENVAELSKDTKFNRSEISTLKQEDEIIKGCQEGFRAKLEAYEGNIEDIKGSVITIETDIKTLLRQSDTRVAN